MIGICQCGTKTRLEPDSDEHYVFWQCERCKEKHERNKNVRIVAEHNKILRKLKLVTR